MRLKKLATDATVYLLFLSALFLSPRISHALMMTATVAGQAAGSPDNGSTSQSATQDRVEATISGSGTGGHVFYAAAVGDQDGNFGTGAYGTGTFQARSEYNYSDTITNASAADQLYSYNFNVEASAIFTSPDEDPNLSLGFTSTASMRFLVYFNNSVIYDESMQVIKIGNTYSSRIDENGIYYQNSDYIVDSNFVGYLWDDFSFSLDLGLIGAGQSANLRYQLISQADSNSAWPGQNYAGSLIGDPAGLNELPFELPINQVQVPEPGTLALLSLGLSGLGFSRRKKA